MTEIPNQSFRMPASDAKKYLEQASALMNIGHFHDAIPLYESALATLERTYGVDQPELAECLQDLGDAYEAGNRLNDALLIHTRLLRLGEKILGKTNPNVVAMLLKLTQLSEMLGRPADALIFCQQAIDSARECLEENDPLSQQIIERYRYLSTLAQTQAQMQAQTAQETQPQMHEEMHELHQAAPPPDWLAEMPPTQIDIDPAQPTNMQDFAREMLRDMPGSPRPFSQAVNADILSAANDSMQQGRSPAYNQAPHAVAPLQNAAPNNEYKSILEAGFSAAQNHSLRSALPGDPYAGVSGSPPPPPPAYEPGGEGYSMTDLDDIRAGRRDTGGVNTPANAAKARRISAEDNKRIRMGRMAKDFALPAFGLIVVVGLLLFMIFSNKGSDQKSVINDQDIAKTAVYGMYRTADGDKEVRLVSGNLALLVTAGSAVEVPYVLITSNWGDLFSALSSSVFQKQIWAEKKDLGLRTQDEIVYYANDGAESKVVAKMKHLAGYAQAYNLKRGEYPRYVNGNMLSEFAFVNPLDGRGSAIPIKTLLSQASDGLDAKGGLESGLEAGLAPNETPSSGNAPFSITCYAVLQGKPEDNLDQIRATKFFVRGCDRNGSFLSSGHPGRSYVVTAADNYLAAIPAGALGDLAARPSTTSRSKLSAKTKIRGKTKGPPKALPESSDSSKADDVQDQNKAAQAALPTVRTEQPDKSTKLWLILNPAYPMLLIHHALPLILLGLAILAYLRAKMVHVEATGPSISATSNAHSHYAKITAAVLLALAVLVIMAQFVIFA